MIRIYSVFIKLWHSVTNKTNKLEPEQKRVRVGGDSLERRSSFLVSRDGSVFMKVVSLKGRVRNQAFWKKSVFIDMCYLYVLFSLWSPSLVTV